MDVLLLSAGVTVASWWILGAPRRAMGPAATPRLARRARADAGWSGAWIRALRTGGRTVGGDTPAELDRLVRGAGRPLGMVAHEWAELERGWGLVAGGLLCIVGGIGLVHLEGLLRLTPIAGAFSLVLPREWLQRRVRARAAHLEARLPSLADRIATVLEGGASIPEALEEVARVEATSPHAPAWFLAELHLAARLLRLSDGSLPQSLNTLAGAIPAPSLTTLSNQLLLAARTGGPTAEVLRDFARQERSTRATERLGRVSDTPVRLAWVGIAPVLACLIVAIAYVVDLLRLGTWGTPP